MIEYPDNIIRHGEHAVGYFTAALRAGVDVTRKHLNSDVYRDVHGYDEIPVDMEYPQEGQHYPYVQVMYQNSKFYPSSPNEAEHRLREITDKGGIIDNYHIYLFDGSYVISIYANTILERETIADCLIGAMGIDDSYRDGFYHTPYMNITPNMHTLSSPTANESIGTPWDSDALTCYRQLKFDVKGEFIYHYDTFARFLERIEIFGRVEEPMDAELSTGS